MKEFEYESGKVSWDLETRPEMIIRYVVLIKKGSPKDFYLEK